MLGSIVINPTTESYGKYIEIVESALAETTSMASLDCQLLRREAINDQEYVMQAVVSED